MFPQTDYETVAASQTDQILGPTGKVGDILSSITIIPATTSPGAVQIQDGGGTEITVFAGGASSVVDLSPIVVFFGPNGIRCVNTSTPGWKVTTGANVSVIANGRFR